MNNKLYVGNLPYQVDNEALKAEFSNHGTVGSVKIITDFDTGRSKGFGFIEMANEDEANTCVQKMDGQEFHGRNLKVSIAKAKQSSPRDNRGNW